MNLTKDQKQALDTVFSWIKAPTYPLIIGGYAGTGKTTLVSLIAQIIHKQSPKTKIAFATFTGKASLILKDYLDRNKSLQKEDFCGTIHSLIYRPQTNSKGQITGWIKNHQIKYDIIIIDEASMVSSDIQKDLEAFKLPTIYIGDHGQLPPIGDRNNLLKNHHIELTQIHRQAKQSPILTLAESVRQGHRLEPNSVSSSHLKVISSNHPDSQDIFESTISKFTSTDKPLILVGRNKTRLQINQQIRTALNYFADQPQPGETLICLKNNYDNKSGPIFNGMIGKLKTLKSYQNHWYQAEIEFDDVEFSGKISKHQFNHPTTLSEVDGLHFSQIGDRFDYGYCLTVHKSQGSQAESVVLFEENAHFWMKQDYFRWLYTGITRAKTNLAIILPPTSSSW